MFKKIEELNRYVENLKEEANLLRHENVSCIHDFNALREDNERLKITLSEYEKRLNESFAERDQIIREASEVGHIVSTCQGSVSGTAQSQK